MDKENDKQQMTEKEKASISVSFCPLALSLSLSVSSSQSIECKSEERQKIHWDEKEKSALLFDAYVRSPIDNYENKEQTK